MRETLATWPPGKPGRWVGRGRGLKWEQWGGGGVAAATRASSGDVGLAPAVPPRTSALLGAETTSDAGGGPQRPFSRGCTPSITLPMSSPYRALTSAPRGPAAAPPLATRLRHRGSPGSPDQKMPGTEDRTSE